MDIIVRRKNRTQLAHLKISKTSIVFMVIFLLLLLPAGTATLGYFMAEYQASDPDAVLSQELAAQRKELDVAIENSKNSVTALSVRLAEIQAQAIRLDALGRRLVEINKLDKAEFDFDNPPAQGGPVADSMMEELAVEDFIVSLNQLSQQLDDRAAQLMVMEEIYMSDNLRSSMIPSGKPVESGWLSSGFGRRTDPFTGKPALHEGVDFAGKAGTGVIAVASGVVTWSGERYGYGKMVELDHGNGYVTRYAHNEENKVEVGETVEKGQVIARMGSSGRSTGPHVHYEVLRKGKPVDPKKYVYR